MGVADCRSFTYGANSDSIDMAAASGSMFSAPPAVTEAGKGCFVASKLIGARADRSLEQCARACYNEPECKSIHHDSTIAAGSEASRCGLLRAGCAYADAVAEGAPWSGGSAIYDVAKATSEVAATTVASRCEIHSAAEGMSGRALATASGKTNYRLV